MLCLWRAPLQPPEVQVERQFTAERALVSHPIESQGFQYGSHWTPSLHVLRKLWSLCMKGLVRSGRGGFPDASGRSYSVSLFLLSFLILQDSVLPRDSL